MASPASGIKAVSSAGTAEALSATSITVCSLIVRARKLNVGAAYIGNSGVSSANCEGLDPGESMSWDYDPAIGLLDLADIYVDVQNDGDGVGFWYIAEE